MTDSLLTIVIPTFERSQSLTLTVNYLLRFSDFKLLVLDASAVPNEHLLGTTNSKLLYRHTPNLSMLERLQSASQLISSPYIQLQPDDDFMLIDSTRTCVNQLISESTTSTCIGSCYSFKALGSYVRFLPEYTSPKYSTNSSSSVTNRLYKSIVDYAPSTIYAVQRSDVYKLWISFLTTIQDIHTLQPVNPYLSEHFHSLFSHIIGSSVVLPVTHWFRSSNNYPTTAQGFSRKIPFHTWLKQDSYRIPLLSETIVSTLDSFYSFPQLQQYPDLGSTVDYYFQQFVSKCFSASRSTFASRFRSKLFLGNSSPFLESFQDRLRSYLRHSLFVSKVFLSPLTLEMLLDKTKTSSEEYYYLKSSFASQ